MKDELNLKEIFSNFIRFINRNIKFIALFISISIMIVLLYYMLLRPSHYSSTAICKSDITKFENSDESQRTAVDLINYLQLFIDVKDAGGLAKLLGIKHEMAQDLISIKATQLYQMDLNEEYKNIDKFELNIVLKSNKYYEEIESSFDYYFDNNPYLKKIYSAYIYAKQNIYNDVVAEISALKNQRNTINSSGDFINTEVNAEGSLNEIVYLSKMRESITRDIETSTLFSYAQSFAKINIPQNDIYLWFGFTFLISFILGSLIALIRELL